MQNYGPTSAFADKLHAEKYRGPNESFRHSMLRVASTLADNPAHFAALKEILLEQRFLPGGRIQAAIGSTKAITAYNCYVSGNIEDTFTEGSGSIMARAREAAITMRQGGGIGYDFSSLRPRGALIRKLQSRSSGPVPFMDIFDAVCRATSSSGHRRGAQMGILRVDHPDIEEFIAAKQNAHRLTGFNISVAITDAFMKAVLEDTGFQLMYDNTPYRVIHARTLWNALMRSTYDWAEPGVIFIDRINTMNNLAYCEEIRATNPCGEQPLPPYGACLLGSFNLTQYLSAQKDPDGDYAFDWERFYRDIPHVVRAMDNIVDVAKYPLHEQEQEALSKRRMGLGVTGVANTIEAMGAPYGSPNFIKLLSIILAGLRDTAYRASVDLAREKGAFPLYRRDKYIKSGFIQTLPENLIDYIYQHGIRNSHLLSIAPTGTISLCADNISSGIEPVFDYSIKRTLIEFSGPVTYELEDYGVKYLDTRGKISDDVTVKEHLAVFTCASQFVDSAVSKTCNLPKDIGWEEFKDVYINAWQAGCKGCTTYRKGGMREAVLTSAKPTVTVDTDPSCGFDPLTGQRTCE